MAVNSGRDAKQDEAGRESFPASDPPASMAHGGARAVPAEELLEHGPPVRGAQTLRRSFPDAERAKLALESLVRDGPVDRNAAGIHPQGAVFELRLAVPPADAARIRRLLAAA